jgi:hypothetical protein
LDRLSIERAPIPALANVGLTAIMLKTAVHAAACSPPRSTATFAVQGDIKGKALG